MQVKQSLTQQAAVKLCNVTRQFREGDRLHVVLENLSAEFAGGESVALRGRSGSGKSTLLNLISGIDAPDEGSIDVAGLGLTAMSERERTLFRRQHIGFVYQAFNLVPALTVADNVKLVLELNQVPDSVAAVRVKSMLSQVGLAGREDSYPDILSGGEQQRVAIARALVHKPLLLLADEPTGNLDDKTAEAVLVLLDKMVRQSGGTLIVATHSARVAEFCDRVLELHDGKLINSSS